MELIRRFWEILPGTALLFVAWFPLGSPCHGEESSSRIVFSRLSEFEGFHAGQVTAMVEDERGMIWLGTDRGLSRFDGAGTLELKHDPNDPDSLSGNRISSLVFGPGGELWVGTADAGLNRVDPVGRKVERLLRPSEGEWLRGKRIASLAVSEQQFLWVGTEKGLDILHLTTGKVRTDTGIALGTHVTTILVVSEDSIWAGTESGEVYRWNRERSAFERQWAAGAPIGAMALASATELWIGTRGQGLLRLDTNTWSPIRVPLASRNVTSLRIDTNADLWVGTSEGLAFLRQGSSDFAYYRNNPRVETTLSHDQVTWLFESRSKVLWVGTDGGGANRFGLDRYWFPHYRVQRDKKEGGGLPNDSIWSMAPARNDGLWVGTESGLTRWNPKNQTWLTPDLGPETSVPTVSAIWETGAGDVWAGTKGDGLIFLSGSDGGRAQLFRHRENDPETIGHDYISALREDTDGRLWIGTHGSGLWRLGETGRGFHRVPVETEGGQAGDSPGKAGFITSFAEDPGGSLWVGATDGLYGLDPAASSLRPYRQRIPKARALSSDSVSAILPAPGGALYLGTADAGLSRLDPESGDVRVFNRANSDLPSDKILGLLLDGQENVWISTPDGIARLDPHADRIRSFDDRDGLQKGTFHPNALAKGSDGALYFGGGQGFHRIDPNSLPVPRQPPTPILTDFEQFGEPVVPRPGGILEKNLAATSEIRMRFDPRNRFAFRFANLDKEHPFRGEFRYRLAGFEDDWQPADRNRRASYMAVRPGNYEFQAQSSPDGKIWNENIAQVKLTIVPPWWQTWWTRTGIGILGLAAAAGLFGALKHSQIQRMQRREEKLKSLCDKAEAQLAVQLQNALLLERSSHAFRDELRMDDIFREPLQNLARHFGYHRALLFSLEKTSEEAYRLAGIGEYRIGNAPSLLHRTIPVTDSFTGEILDSKEPVRRENLLAMRTCFQGIPNGVLLLRDSDGAHPHDLDEPRLLQSVAVQFGIAVAQRALTIKEEGYRQELERARREADAANRAKSAFLARMTHDLRTPLSAIIGFTQLLQEEKTLEKRQIDLINIINDSGEHLLEVVNDILDVSKIEAGKAEVHPERFELLPFLHGVREILRGKAESKGLAFKFSAPAPLPRLVETDRGKLRQILVNLLGNAIKFTDCGAIGLRVTARALTSPAPGDGEGKRRKTVLLFQVSDTGRGISREELPKLFEEFSQAQSGKLASESSGLGLSIAKGLVQLLGGEIQARSELGAGTTFRFSIPCDEIVASGQTGAASSAGSDSGDGGPRVVTGLADPSRPIRILIAEDQPLNRLLLTKILSRVGFDLVEAVDGLDACEKWRETRPDLILMDENMPGMSGMEATRTILGECEEGAEPVIVALTAHAFEQARKDALAAGCRDFLSKPFKNEDLMTVIANHLGIAYTYAEEPAKPQNADCAII